MARTRRPGGTTTSSGCGSTSAPATPARCISMPSTGIARPDGRYPIADGTTTKIINNSRPPSRRRGYPTSAFERGSTITIDASAAPTVLSGIWAAGRRRASSPPSHHQGVAQPGPSPSPSPVFRARSIAVADPSPSPSPSPPPPSAGRRRRRARRLRLAITVAAPRVAEPVAFAWPVASPSPSRAQPLAVAEPSPGIIRLGQATVVATTATTTAIVGPSRRDGRGPHRSMAAAWPERCPPAGPHATVTAQSSTRSTATCGPQQWEPSQYTWTLSSAVKNGAGRYGGVDATTLSVEAANAGSG
jgi:hypothetical protein